MHHCDQNGDVGPIVVHPCLIMLQPHFETSQQVEYKGSSQGCRAASCAPNFETRYEKGRTHRCPG